MFRRKPTGVSLLAPALLAGCGAIFGIDDPERPGPPPSGGGSGGASGAGTSGGGRSGGGAGGTVEPQGGSGMAGDGGEVATGGSSGNATGGDDSGGGDGGGGDGDEFPSKGEPCATPGALACLGPAQKKRLICKGGVWDYADACPPDTPTIKENCDRRSGACAVVPNVCWSLTTSEYEDCPEWGTAVLSCGPDLVNLIEVEQCDLGCNPDTGRCAEPSGDELFIDRVPPTREDFVFWPTPVIPVCFQDEDDETDFEQAAIRDEVESTWGRYSSVAFSGWNVCSSSPTDLAEAQIAFVENCVGELARIPRYGYPGPEAKLELKICKSYVDANNETQMADGAVLRYVARHLFGHVLGRAHDSVGDFMTGVIDLSWIPDLVFGERTIEVFQQTYGGKPSGSLVNAGGRCVGWSNESAVDMRVCDGSTETRWQAFKGQLAAEGGARCLGASGSESATLASCETTPEDLVWETNDVQWRGYGGRCVTKSTASSDASLVLEQCRALGDADQTWSFDFYDNRRVRISRAGDQCVHIPEVDGGAPRRPELAPCDDSDGARDGLETTRSGQLALSGYCIESDASSDYELRLAPCRAIAAQSYYLSGPLGHEDGAVLTLLATGDLGAATLEGAPSQAQIFDYHF